MKIYTKTGDNLKTSIITKRVDKDHLVVEVNGEIDELMASIMVSYNMSSDEKIKNVLITLVQSLFTISGDLILKTNKINNEDVYNLEKLIDEFDEELLPLNDFILPGKNLESSFINLSRTICRRVERRLVSLAKEEVINKYILQFINRASDLLFVLSRYSERGLE